MPKPTLFHRTFLLIVLCLVSLWFAHSVQAGTKSEELIAQVNVLKLAQNPRWLKLIHFEPKEHKSVVLTDEFFLSPNGRNSANDELIATIEAYFLPLTSDCNNHPRCRFPARYYWLSRYLDLPGYDVHQQFCSALNKWALIDQVHSISVLLVSGYLGNPASTFGHALLKFNTDSPDDPYGLFDLTLNYGAMVPEHENSLIYVVRGLFGGYKAGFSDKYFYTEDLVYSRREFRDMWDYRLALTEFQRTLLILHIWEIVGKKFNYYFLDKNCAFRLAELLELVIDKNLTGKVKLWYFPVELFYRLNTGQSPDNPVQSISFIPSSQRILYNQLKFFSAGELNIINAVIKDRSRSITEHLDLLGINQKIHVLDGLLAYQQYRLIAEEPYPSPNRRELKDRILLERLQLPVKEKEGVVIKELPSPADGARPMEASIAYATQKNKPGFLKMDVTAFKQDNVGKNSLEGDELVLFDASFGFSPDDHRLFVDRMDIARLLNLNTLPISLVDENRWSWQMRIGSERVYDSGQQYYDGVGSFGIGRAYQWSEAFLGYWMVDIAGHTHEDYVRIRPHVNVRFEFKDWRAWLYTGFESDQYFGRFNSVWGGKFEYAISSRSSIHAELTNERATLCSVGISWYW